MNIKVYYWMKNPRNQSIWEDVQFNSRIGIKKLVIKLKRWLLVVKMIKKSCK